MHAVTRHTAKHVTSTGWLASLLEDTEIIKEGRGI